MGNTSDLLFAGAGLVSSTMILVRSLRSWRSASSAWTSRTRVAASAVPFDRHELPFVMAISTAIWIGSLWYLLSCLRIL